NCPQFLIAELGAWKAGAVVSPLNPMYTDRELGEALERTGAETVVALTRFYSRVKRVQARTAVRRVVATSIKEYLPGALRIAYTLFRERAAGDRVSVRDGDLRLPELLRRYRGAAPPAVRVGPDDPALLLMSGGTTGTPKAVVGLHRSLVASGLQLRSWLHAALGEWDDVILLPLPLFHVYGNVGGQGVALIGHNPLALVPDPHDVTDVVRTLARVRPAFFVSVPALFGALLRHPDVRSGRADFRSLKACFSGASALLAETKLRFEEMTGGRIVEGYSLTEAMMACTVNPVAGENKLGSVGMPLPDVEVRIVDDGGERELPAGEAGEILLRAPQLMAGYWGDEAETREVLRPHGQGAPWLHTGDVGYLDGDGYLFVVDRKKDVIKAGGFQVWPREVEEAVATHPAVAEVGVAGVVDPVRGEQVRAWVVARPGMRVTEEEIRDHCRLTLAPYKVPARVELVAELPKSPLGKVLRRVLQAGGVQPAGEPARAPAPG
ncbi:MAG TPA: AMP-binding protein, partial [Longimicrobiaceae bacterium]|nr:AMP-binding protein [Longimicrobiaceae bacterium]